MLIEGIPGYELSRIVVWTVAACLAVFFIGMGALALKTRFARSKVGREGLYRCYWRCAAKPGAEWHGLCAGGAVGHPG